MTPNVAEKWNCCRADEVKASTLSPCGHTGMRCQVLPLIILGECWDQSQASLLYDLKGY